MRVRLNGEETQLSEGLTVQGLVERMGIAPSQVGVAVAVNRRVIPRAEWAQTPIKEGDQIELVYARQGG
ncbi:MAG: sulfur carrier protein ThiS [Bacteroidia bacterium]|jgi:sulfur carrier protein|nr:sulfur carrier protein ThiS [Bacteroidia bacterium]GIV23690.1 MAG: hypothetical protein KatS3mg025_1349 [Bacteroidia bacterium]